MEPVINGMKSRVTLLKKIVFTEEKNFLSGERKIRLTVHNLLWHLQHLQQSHNKFIKL